MTVIAAIDDTSYQAVLVLHIVAAVVGFAPAITTVVTPRARAGAGNGAGDEAAVRTGRMIYTPALILAGLLGIVLILLSDEAWEFSDVWISAAFLVWIAVLGVYHAMVIRGHRTGGDAGRRQVVLGSQIIAVLVVVMVYLMVFKPGT